MLTASKVRSCVFNFSGKSRVRHATFSVAFVRAQTFTIDRSPRRATLTRKRERWRPLHLHLRLSSPRSINTTPQSLQMILHPSRRLVLCIPLPIKTFRRADHESRLNGIFIRPHPSLLQHPSLHFQRNRKQRPFNGLYLLYRRISLLVVMNVKHFLAVSPCEDYMVNEEDWHNVLFPNDTVVNISDVSK
jgi:hypothetical protein